MYYKVISPSQYKEYLLCKTHEWNNDNGKGCHIQIIKQVLAPSSWNIFRTYVFRFHTHNKFTHLLIHTLTQAIMYTYVTLKPQGTIKTSTNLKLEVANGKMEVGSHVIISQ